MEAAGTAGTACAQAGEAAEVPATAVEAVPAATKDAAAPTAMGVAAPTAVDTSLSTTHESALSTADTTAAISAADEAASAHPTTKETTSAPATAAKLLAVSRKETTVQAVSADEVQATQLHHCGKLRWNERQMSCIATSSYVCGPHHNVVLIAHRSVLLDSIPYRPNRPPFRAATTPLHVEQIHPENPASSDLSCCLGSAQACSPMWYGRRGRISSQSHLSIYPLPIPSSHSVYLTRLCHTRCSNDS